MFLLLFYRFHPFIFLIFANFNVYCRHNFGGNKEGNTNTCTPWHLRPARKCAADASAVAMAVPVDQILQDNKVEQIQTAIRGRVPSAKKLNLSDFVIKQSESGTPTQITCPKEQTVVVQQSSQKKGFVAHFEGKVCLTCPFLQKCVAQPRKRDPDFHMRFNQKQVNMSQRRRNSLIHQKEGRNLRAAIEGTVHQVKHPFPAGKLPVRGRFRVTSMMIGSVAMANIFRIQRYLEAKEKEENKRMRLMNEQKCSQEQPLVSFFASLIAVFRVQMTPIRLQLGGFGY